MFHIPQSTLQPDLTSFKFRFQECKRQVSLLILFMAYILNNVYIAIASKFKRVIEFLLLIKNLH